jgi:hypothetical protein
MSVTLLNSRRPLAAAVVAFVSAWLLEAQPVHAQSAPPRDGGWRPTAVEIMQLPEFCWGQFAQVKGPEYEIPKKLCGSAMNHYCPGLVEHLRAKRSHGDPGARLGHLERAKKRTLTTLRGMEKYPNCPIRSHAENTLKIVEMQRKGAGGK